MQLDCGAMDGWGCCQEGLQGLVAARSDQPRLGPTCWLLPAHQVWGLEAGTQPAVSGNKSSWNSTA